MKDFFGQDLQIGDEVAFVLPFNRQMGGGVIIDFTPKNIRLAYLPQKSDYTGYRAFTTPDGRIWADTHLLPPFNVVKKPV